MSNRHRVIMTKTLVAILALGASYATPTLAQDQADEAEEAPAGLLPLPGYEGDLSGRSHLSGDWGGKRTEWAEEQGIQFDIDLVQWAEQVADGGVSDDTELGGNATYNLEWDLHRAGILPGAIISARAESRWGSSTMLNTGLVVPSSTAALTPTNYSDFDAGYDIALTQLAYMQFFTEHVGIIVGKLDLFADGDANEFATGRGRTQFNHWSMNYPTGVLLVPASTLGGGIIYEPNHRTNFSTMLVSGKECVRGDCFDDLESGGGVSATTAGFQWGEGGLPGGITANYMYFFDFDFTDFGEIAPLPPGSGLSGAEKDTSWLVGGSFWQYVSTKDSHKGPINLRNRLPDLRGWGIFGRFTYTDEDTNPWKTSISLGVGGRGIFESRPDDLFGLGYFYNDLSTDRYLPVLGFEDQGEGYEAFYNLAITKSVRLGTNVQYLNSILPGEDDAVVVMGRLQVIF